MPKSTFSKEYQQFCRALVEARQRAGLTQREVAARLKRPPSFVAKYESGERRLDVVEFFEVARAVGIKPLRFLGDLEKLWSGQ